MNKHLSKEDQRRYLREAKRYAKIMSLPPRVNTDLEAKQILMRWNTPHEEIIEDAKRKPIAA